MGTGVLTLPGASGEYVSTPDAAPLDIVGDLELRFRGRDDGTRTRFVSKWEQVNHNSFTLEQDGGDKLRLYWSEDGTVPKNAISTVAYTLPGSGPMWYRVTFDVDNDASGYDVKFYTSDTDTNDPASVSWSQLGATVVGGAPTSIFSLDSIVEVGSSDGGAFGQHNGTVYRAQILNGIGGTVELDADFTDLTVGEVAAKAFIEDSVNAATMTINGSAWTYDYGVTINRTNIIFVAAD